MMKKRGKRMKFRWRIWKLENDFDFPDQYSFYKKNPITYYIPIMGFLKVKVCRNEDEVIKFKDEMLNKYKYKITTFKKDVRYYE